MHKTSSMKIQKSQKINAVLDNFHKKNFKHKLMNRDKNKTF